MQVVIDIPQTTYNHVFDNAGISNNDLRNILLGICKSVVLPSGHGRLIDADAIKYNYFMYPETDNPTKIAVSKDKIDAMPTIIKADTEG